MTAVAVIAALIALICFLRMRALQHRVHGLEAAKRVTASTIARLRTDLAAARTEADTARTQRDTAAEAADALRSELEKGLRWRSELRQAAAEETFLMRPPRNKRDNFADRAADAWASHMHARWASPTVIPPHEQPDGDTQ